MKHRVSLVVCLAALGIAPALILASERPHFDSTPRTNTITIDGRQDDWSGALSPLGNEPFSFQAVNDGDTLYLRLAASDATAKTQILRQGLIVWFDEGGGTKKRLGIHYPVVERGWGGERGARGYGRGGRERGDQETPRDDYEPPDRVDILGPGKNDARSLTLDHATGVEVALRVIEGSMLYELKVPLAKTPDHPYAIGAIPGATIGVGFETPKVERSSEGGRGGFGGRGGGMGGMRGRGRPGGGEGGREFQPPKPIKQWTTVTLSRPQAR